jgi:uncharacterized Zn-binding protein involved in type VI secretion
MGIETVSKPLIVLGDKTSHGGTVITAAPTTDTQSKPWARMGDKVACPLCKGVFPIAEGDPSLIEDGKPVAYHGCKTACGAILIASNQVVTSTQPSGGAGAAGASAGSSAAQASDGGGAGGGESSSGGGSGAGTSTVAGAMAAGFGNIGAAMAAGYEDEPVDDTGQHFRGRFQVLDADTGQPLAGQPARVRSTGGQYLTGTTDAEGFTQWVDRDASEELAFDITEPQP